MKIREIYNGKAADITHIYISAGSVTRGATDVLFKKTDNGIELTHQMVGDGIIGRCNKSVKNYTNITIQDVYSALMNTDVEVIKSDIEVEEVGYVFSDDNLDGGAECCVTYRVDYEMVGYITTYDYECKSFRKVIDAFVDDFEEFKEFRAFVNGDVNYNE